MRRVQTWIGYGVVALALGGTPGLVSAACPGGICYVDDNCSTPTDGTSGDPDCTIQDGINRADNGETVLVRSGTYGRIQLFQKSITVRRETTSILPRITMTNAMVKVEFWNSNTSVLDGFEISGGAGRGIFAHGDSSPTIKNCLITGNNGSQGGGILLDNSNARIIDCVIEDNQADFDFGGGIYIRKTGQHSAPTPQITGCTIQGNSAFGNGGGIAIKFARPLITNCVISGNSTAGDQGGGGIWVNDIESSGEGGTAANPGCGSGCTGSAVLRLTNNLITGNSATHTTSGNGGGLFLSLNASSEDGWTDISNCTISGNTAAVRGGGIFAIFRCFSLTNSILWDNSAGTAGPELALDKSTGFVRYSDIEGGFAGASLQNGATLCAGTACGVSGILDSDPNFCDPPDDYRLCRTSPCIDAGDNAGVAADLADLDGDSNTSEAIPYDLDDDPRFVNDLCTTDTGCGSAPIVDMGAYELQVVQAQIVDWKSLVTHGASNTIGLVVPSDATFSESRNGGVTKLRVSFSSPIDPNSVSASNVVKCGKDVNGQAVDLSGITVTTSVLSGDMAVDINFSPKLPNYARYRVRLNGVEDVDCNEITTNNERILTALFGDATGDRRVNANDIGGVRSLIGTSPIDPQVTNQIRSDVDNDDDIDQTDEDLVRGEVPKDARYIADPTCP